jgi:DNA polymerase I
MLGQYREIWTADFEYRQNPDFRPLPVCLTARELRTDRRVTLRAGEFDREPPYPTDPGSLFVSYHASAETTCHLALGWPVPKSVLDLEAEFRCTTTGYQVDGGKGIVGAAQAYGFSGISVLEKKDMIKLILRGDYTPAEMEAIVDYCWGDTDAAAELLPRMLPEILARPHGWEMALLRGEYSGHSVAMMEHTGTPLDRETLNRLRRSWDTIKVCLVEQYDKEYDVYEGMTFVMKRFIEYLSRKNIPWPTLGEGRKAETAKRPDQLDLSDDTFKEMGELFPQVENLRQLRHTLSQLRLSDLTMGRDGRNRCMLGQFVAKTGRNAPQAGKYIFGPSAWLRGLIQPECGHALAYIDWSQQEFVIAAALSGDQSMLAAIASEDAYLYFAKMANLAPPDATRETHEHVRETCKRCCLGVLYGMGVRALAFRTQKSEAEAKDLMERHRRVFPTFWAWSDRAVREASLIGHIDLAYGWRIHDGPDMGPRSLMNAPMQGNAASMMQIAACLATRARVQVDSVLHDAFLIEADARDIDDAIATMQTAMGRASRAVLDGVEVKTDVKKVVWPNRYMDGRKAAQRMWNTVMGYLDGLEVEPTDLATYGDPTSPQKARYIATHGDPVQSVIESFS